MTPPDPSVSLRGRLDRDLVVQTALDIVDGEGSDALTMRRLARELGVEAMSLYNHVSNKEDLRDAVVDLVLSEVEVPPFGDRDWRAYATLLARNLRVALLRHPAVAAGIGASHLDPEATPAGARLFDAAIANASRAGFSDDALRRAIHLTMMATLGWTVLEARADDNGFPEFDLDDDSDPAQLDYDAFFDVDLDAQFDLMVDITIDGIERRFLRGPSAAMGA